MLKLIIPCLLISLISTKTFAKYDLYFVDPMICTGKIAPTHQDKLYPCYHQMLIYVTSFWSTRKDGSLAPSLEVSTNFFDKDEEINLDKDYSGSGWYMGPIRKYANGNISFDYDGHENSTLSYIRTEVVDGQQFDYYQGTLNYWPQYPFNVSCKATVVDNPSKIIDKTKPEN